MLFIWRRRSLFFLVEVFFLMKVFFSLWAIYFAKISDRQHKGSLLAASALTQSFWASNLIRFSGGKLWFFPFSRECTEDKKYLYSNPDLKHECHWDGNKGWRILSNKMCWKWRRLGFWYSIEVKSQLHNLLYVWLQSSYVSFPRVDSHLCQMQIIIPELYAVKKIYKITLEKCQKQNKKFEMTVFSSSSLVGCPCATDAPTLALPLTLCLFSNNTFQELGLQKATPNSNDNQGRWSHQVTALSNGNSKQLLPVKGLHGACHLLPPGFLRSQWLPQFRHSRLQSLPLRYATGFYPRFIPLELTQ